MKKQSKFILSIPHDLTPTYKNPTQFDCVVYIQSFNSLWWISDIKLPAEMLLHVQSNAKLFEFIKNAAGIIVTGKQIGRAHV